MMMLKRLKLSDLKPGMTFGYSFPTHEGGMSRRYCVGIVARVDERQKLYVKRAKLVSGGQWEIYSGEALSGYEPERWELYEYDKDALWAAHCAQMLIL